jgi:predicted outer membrane repeat protein
MHPKVRSIFNSVVLLVLLLGVGGVSAESGVMATAAQAATILYAKPGGATTGTCVSWAAACELRYALGTVAVAGDELWVARGVYIPTASTDQTISFALRSGLALYGGFAGSETSRDQRNWAVNVTVLSGDIDHNDLTDANDVVTDTQNIKGTNAYRVVTSSSGITETAVLDGFTLTGGNAKGTSYDRGGGMFNYGGSPTLINITFSGNLATTYGGGMFNYGGSPTLTNVTFSGNSASTGGGGMASLDDSHPTLTNVTFRDNFAISGGGMYNDSVLNLVLTNVTFSGNSAVNGGGMYTGNSSSPTLTNVTFSDNSAVAFGGGIYNSTCNPIVRNTLFVKGASANNCAGDAFAAGSTTNLADDTSCGSSTTQSANINLGLLGNYGGSTQTIPLLPGSAAIDAGNNAYCPATDQRGVGRGGRCDIGAFEAQRTIYLPLTLKNSRSYFEGPSEIENNDAYTEANGPLRSGRVYSGLFNDEKDYFSVYLDATGTISATATHTRTTVQMQLFYQVADVDHRLMIDYAGKHVEYTANASHLGWYYIYLNAGPEPAGEPYTLLVTYP